MTVLTKEEAGIALGTEEGNVEIMSLNDSFKSTGLSNNEEGKDRDGKVFTRKHLRETLVRFVTPKTHSSFQ
jgi:hypothetical protein